MKVNFLSPKLFLTLFIFILSQLGCGNPSTESRRQDQGQSAEQNPLEFSGVDEGMQISDGRILGYFDASTKTYSFKGIPYAAAPLGPLRWRPPQNVTPWNDRRDASRFSPPCLQKMTPLYGIIQDALGSEDCLYLNVYSPQSSNGSQELLPVIFWIHGGGNAMGSASDKLYSRFLYDGGKLSAAGPAVVVTVNYRLGPFGFLSHPRIALDNPLGVQSNFGLLDLIAALKWVQKNVIVFGGDPQKVSLVGQSAGAANALALLSSPLAKGLFSSAIIQSGIPIHSESQHAKAMTAKLIHKIGCDRDLNPVDCMRNTEASKILSAIPKEASELTEKAAFYPIVDGIVVTQSTFQAIDSGLAAAVPVMMGSNQDELDVILPAIFNKVIVAEWTYRSFVKKTLGKEIGDLALRMYPSHQHWGAKNALSHLLSDAIFHCPQRQMLRKLAKRSTVKSYRYLFSHVSDKWMLKPFGASHGFEIPYLFGHFPKGLFIGPTSEDLSLSKAMMKIWVQFAANGIPSLGDAGDIQWESYDAERDNYLDINSDLSQKEGFKAGECDFWDQQKTPWQNN